MHNVQSDQLGTRVSYSLFWTCVHGHDALTRSFNPFKTRGNRVVFYKLLSTTCESAAMVRSGLSTRGEYQNIYGLAFPAFQGLYPHNRRDVEKGWPWTSKTTFDAADIFH